MFRGSFMNSLGAAAKATGIAMNLQSPLAAIASTPTQKTSHTP